jgi:type IV pilus assembly protein PilE
MRNHTSAAGFNTVSRGFTLVELMITVAIVAILAAVAYPAYTSQVVSARRSDGQAKLLEIMQAQERYYTTQNTYTADMTDLGYSNDPADSDENWYQVDGQACGGSTLAECIVLTATAQGDQATKDTECGNLSLNSRGAKGESGTGTVDDCW